MQPSLDPLLPVRSWGDRFASLGLALVALANLSFIAGALYFGTPGSLPRSRSPAVARGLHAGRGAAPLEAAPSAEPDKPLPFVETAWLDETTRLRSMRPTDPGETEHLAALLRHAAGLFPAFVGEPPKAREPLELRLVEPGVLDDPTYFDTGATGSLLGMYFPAARFAYAATPAPLEPYVFLHEVAHHFLDVYGVEVNPEVEEFRADTFARYADRFEWFLAHPRHRQASAARPARAGTTSFAAASEPRRIWLARTLATAQRLLPSAAGLAAADPAALFELVSDENGWRCAARPNGSERLRLWLDGCGYDVPVSRGLQEVGHALGHVWAEGQELSPEAEELAAYTLGARLEKEFRQRHWPLVPGR